MDFLEIRKKAKERAARAAEPAAPAGPAAPDAAPPGLAPGRPPAPAEAPVPPGPSEADLTGRLEPLPTAEDGRFTTWRPGSDAPPPLPPPPPAAVAEPDPADFTVFSPQEAPAGAGQAPLPLAVPAPLPEAPARAPREERRERVRPPPPRSPLEEFFYRPDEEAPELPSFAGPDASGPEPEPESLAREEYLTFLLGPEEYAVPVEQVREVLKAPPITEVPRAPAGVVGVVTVRGDVIAVFDPRRRLGLPAPSPGEGADRIVIVDAGEGPTGLVVDRVASVVRLRPGTVEPCPQGIGGAAADCLTGIGRERDRLFTVLDLAALLRRAPRGEGRAHGP